MSVSAVAEKHNATGWRHYWELFVQFTARAVETRHRGSHLGLVWAVLTPLLMLGLYTFVFGAVMGGSFHVRPNETGVDFALGVFLGLIIFHVLGETMGATTGLIVSNPNLVKKVVFPTAILPLAQVASFWVNFAISLGLLLIGMLLTERPFTLEGLLWLPALLLPHLALTAGVGLTFSALGVFFRDLGQIMPFVAQALLYASALFFSVERISATAWTFLKWNPVLHTVHLARDALLWHRPINLHHLGYTYACGFTALVIGIWIFRKTKNGFADVL